MSADQSAEEGGCYLCRPEDPSAAEEGCGACDRAYAAWVRAQLDRGFNGF